MALLAPSDSPGGFTQTYASIPLAGAAFGRSPMPAPDWLHQSPACGRRSTRSALTCVLMSLAELGPVGRFGPPQPLREVSISMPMFGRNPSVTSWLRNAVANVDSSTYRFQSIHLDWRVWSLTGRYGSVSAE